MSNWNSAVLALWVVFWVYWFFAAVRTHARIKRRETFVSRWLHWILYILSYVVLFSYPAGLGPLSFRFLPDDIISRWIGLGILVLGLSFAVWARLQLGQYWSGRVLIKVDHKLIRTGPYRIVRHPIYTGMLLGFVGTAIAIGEIRVWLAFVLALAALLIKIGAEERFMVEEFGAAYLQYKREVKMVIPYLI